MHVSGEIDGARIQVANRISELVRALCFNPMLKNRRRSQDGPRCRCIPLQRLLERLKPNSEFFGPRWNNVAGSLEIRTKHSSLHQAISVREVACIRALSAELGLSWKAANHPLQVASAVPPQMATAVAKTIMSHLPKSGSARRN